MSFVLNEDEQTLRDSARAFLNESAPVTALRALRDEKSPTGFSSELWSSFAEMGWSGVLVSEDHGGVDMGYAAAGLVLEEMGRTQEQFGSTNSQLEIILQEHSVRFNTAHSAFDQLMHIERAFAKLWLLKIERESFS